MEKTLVILKPSAIARELIGNVISRFERKGLIIVGIKMVKLSKSLLEQHYSHLVNKPFFQSVLDSMTALPVIVLCIKGKNAVEVVRVLTGTTNSRTAAPGTIRGDYGMSNQENIIHASDSVENAEIELKRFFRDDEIFDYLPAKLNFIYASDEA